MTSDDPESSTPTAGSRGRDRRASTAFLRSHPDVGAVADRGRLEHPDARPARQLVPLPRPAAVELAGGRVPGFDDLTLDNYREIFGTTAAGGMKQGLTNSFAIALPATIIPIAFAAFAAYAFAWIDFKRRQGLFIGTVALLAVPLQVALIPLLQMYVGGAHFTIPWLDKTITLFPDLDLAGTTTAVWLTHTGFAMPFAIFLLHNYIIGAAEGHVRVGAHRRGQPLHGSSGASCCRCRCPVLAAFAIFQFLWTWNDYLDRRRR